MALYALTLILEAKKCNRIEPPPSAAPKNAQENAYFQIEGVGYDLCAQSLDRQSVLDIQVSIFVKDSNTGKPVIWKSQTGFPNPARYTRSDLKPFRTYTDCLSSAVPGNQKFDIQVKIVGDCCKFYGECNTNGNRYWKRTIFLGSTTNRAYEDIYNNGYCIFGIRMGASGQGEDNGDSPCRI